MPRAATLMVVLGALAITSISLGSGCAPGGAGDAEGGPAGKVVEVEGEVTAAREGKPVRPLHQGDAVYRDDTVKTAARAQVTIVLGHNDARWSLAGGRSRRVDRSPAWRAARGQKSGSTFDDDEALPTSSAGRHSEPQVGDTRATAPTPQAPTAESATRVAEAEPDRATRPKRHRGERAKGSAAPKPGGGGAGDPMSSDALPDGIALGAVPAAGGGNRGEALSLAGAPRAVLGALSVSGARKRAEVAEAVGQVVDRAAQLCAMEASSGTVKVRFQIGRKGDVDAVRVTGSAALVGKVGRCLEKQIGDASFAARREGTTRITQSIRFEVP